MGCMFPPIVTRNNDANQAELKDTGGHIPDTNQKVIQASPATQTQQGGLEIVLKTNRDQAKSVKSVEPTEERPYVYVQPNDDLTRLINKAAQIKDDKQAIKELENIVAQINAKNDKSLQFMQKLAFVSTCLAERYAKVDLLMKCKEQEHRALSIYSQFQSEFFEELIVILNNSALRYQRAGQYEQAIGKYKNIAKLEDKYYSIHDERKLLSMNNLACLYFQARKRAEGQELFGKILDKLKQHKYSSELVNLIYSNYQYYKKQSPQ